MFGKIKDYIYNDEIDIRQRMFLMNMINVCSILLIVVVESILMDSPLDEILVILIFDLILILIGILSFRKNKPGRGALIVTTLMVIVFAPVTFFTNGGISGTGPIWFFYNYVIISILLGGTARIVFYILQQVIAVVCLILYHFAPELFKITGITGGLKHWIYYSTVLILVSVSISMMLYVENRLYIRRNEIAKNQQLEIEGLVASQNRFFSSMSHEIRTPINTIIGLNEMILRENISDEITEDAVNIRAAGRMLLNTINDILDMSKFQSGDMHLVIDTYKTGDMLSDLVGMLWLRAKEKNLDLKVKVAPDIPTQLKGDEMRIKQVLMNILNNAIKYTKEGYVSLSVECEKDEDGNIKMIYTVEDTGIGIKKEDIPFLFTAFKRVDETATKHIEGTGLGLSIVKQFLDLMGGKITVNSVYTKGSTFVIEIPQKVASTEEIGEYDYSKKHKLSKRETYSARFEAPEARILVVDDNEANLLVVSKLLRDTKVKLDTAVSGKEALQKTLDKAYNLIFMDHLMPEMDGIECLRAIRSQVGGQCREVPIVILTANAGEENRRLYAIEGFNGYLVKPITGEEIENEVYRQLPSQLIRITSTEGILNEENVSWVGYNRKKRIAVTTESTADLPVKLINKYDIGVFSQKVQTKDGIFREKKEIDTNGLLKYMEDLDNKVVPYMPTSADYEAFFSEQLKTANNVIHVSISGGIDGSAYYIAKEASNAFDNVLVVDSRHLSSAQGLVALFAVRMAEAGMGLAEIDTRLVHLKKRIKACFMVGNMDYMARTGMVGQSFANLTKLLTLRPVTMIKDGKIVSKGMFFGSDKRARSKFISVSLSIRNINKTAIFVNHVGLSKKELEWIKQEIEKKIKFETIYFIQTSPIIAISCGPGSFGLTLVTD